MKFTLPILLTLVTSAYCAVLIPRGTSSAVINITPTSLRIYHQESNIGIKEISVGAPPSFPSNDGYMFTGQTRKNTPLAAITWTDPKASYPEIRVYFITPSNTLGEVAFIGGTWNSGGNLGFPIAADSNVLYGTKAGDFLIVGYTNQEGYLSEAYYDLKNPGWKSYTL